MSVLVNEFEVVPSERERPAEQRRQQQQPAETPPTAIHVEVERTLIPHRSGIGLLRRPPRPDAAEPINMAMVREVADVLTRLVDVTVADTPTAYDERTLAVLDRADCTVLVVTPDLSAVRNLREFLALAQSIGYSQERMLLVLNRATLRTGVGASDVREATAMAIAVEIPDGGAELSLRANLGTPMVLAANR